MIQEHYDNRDVVLDDFINIEVSIPIYSKKKANAHEEGSISVF